MKEITIVQLSLASWTFLFVIVLLICSTLAILRWVSIRQALEKSPHFQRCPLFEENKNAHNSIQSRDLNDEQQLLDEPMEQNSSESVKKQGRRVTCSFSEQRCSKYFWMCEVEVHDRVMLHIRSVYLIMTHIFLATINFAITLLGG